MIENKYFLKNKFSFRVLWSYAHLFCLLFAFEVGYRTQSLIGVLLGPSEVGAFISSWGHILPPPLFPLRLYRGRVLFKNVAEFCNDQVIYRFYLVTWLVCIIRKIPHIIDWVKI